jgi:hypothetical protein
MNNTSKRDNFERIAQDAVSALTAAAITLQIIGENELALAICDTTEALCNRAIALGAV